MIIERCLKKVKELILTKPTTVVRAVSIGMDSIATNLSMLELGNLAFKAGDFEIEESISFPFQYEAGEYLGQIYDLTNGVKMQLWQENWQIMWCSFMPIFTQKQRMPIICQKKLKESARISRGCQM